MSTSVAVTFISPDGLARQVTAPVGASLMEAAVRNGVDGIEAKCGGACACATCHVMVDVRCMPLLAAPSSMEDEMLECVQDRTPQSRLACQIQLTPSLEGLVVTLPVSQG